MLGESLDRLGAFVRGNLALCILLAAAAAVIAIVFNIMASKNSFWMHIVALGGMALGTFLMVLCGRTDAAPYAVSADDAQDDLDTIAPAPQRVHAAAPPS